MRRVRPLVLQVLGRRDYRECGDLPARQQFGSDGERERCLPCAGRRDQKEVTRVCPEVGLVGLFLPCAQSKELLWPRWLIGLTGVITGGGCGDGHRSERLPAPAGSHAERHEPIAGGPEFRTFSGSVLPVADSRHSVVPVQDMQVFA